MCDGSCGGRRLSRRTFLAETTMAAVAAALTSACGDGVFGGALGPGQTVALAINVNDFAALDAGRRASPGWTATPAPRWRCTTAGSTPTAPTR